MEGINGVQQKNTVKNYQLPQKKTANHNFHENQASNSSDDTHERIPHETQDLNSVQSKIESNKAGKKFNKQENKRMLLEWKLKRVKGQEDWKNEH